MRQMEERNYRYKNKEMKRKKEQGETIYHGDPIFRIGKMGWTVKPV